MKMTAVILQNAIRIVGLILIILGFLFWTGHAFTLIRLHMWLGVVLVILLWGVAGTGVRAGVGAGLPIVCFLWGLLVVVFGMTMGRLLPGRSHELIRVLHFLIGVAAIGLAESVAARIKRRLLAGTV